MSLGAVLPKPELDDDVFTVAVSTGSEDQPDRADPFSVGELYGLSSSAGRVLRDICNVRSRIREFDLCPINDVVLWISVHFAKGLEQPSKGGQEPKEVFNGFRIKLVEMKRQ